MVWCRHREPSPIRFGSAEGRRRLMPWPEVGLRSPWRSLCRKSTAAARRPEWPTQRAGSPRSPPSRPCVGTNHLLRGRHSSSARWPQVSTRAKATSTWPSWAMLTCSTFLRCSTQFKVNWGVERTSSSSCAVRLTFIPMKHRLVQVAAMTLIHVKDEYPTTAVWWRAMVMARLPPVRPGRRPAVRRRVRRRWLRRPARETPWPTCSTPCRRCPAPNG